VATTRAFGMGARRPFDDLVAALTGGGCTPDVAHGAATEIQIGLEFRGADIALRVVDNGGGFVVDLDAESAENEEHLGLLGMQERASRIRGRLSITSRPGAGTVVEVTAPADGK